jgi:hypothetical protein
MPKIPLWEYRNTSKQVRSQERTYKSKLRFAISEEEEQILAFDLRPLVSADTRDWVDYVGRAKFSRTVAMHLATKGSSFVVAYGMRFNLLT